MSEDKAQASKFVLSFGGYWANLFQDSLARRFANIHHFNLGNPKYKIEIELFNAITEGLTEDEKRDVYSRVNSSSRQSSELIWKLEWYISKSTHVLIDSGLLDTAIGHHVLVKSKELVKPCWAISVDDKSSPLAAAFLKGIVFPASSDDLVSLVLQN